MTLCGGVCVRERVSEIKRERESVCSCKIGIKKIFYCRLNFLDAFNDKGWRNLNDSALNCSAKVST